MDKYSNLEKYTKPASALCNKTHVQLEGICKEGDVVEIFFSRYEKDTILVHGRYAQKDIEELREKYPNASPVDLVKLAKKHNLPLHNEVIAKKGSVNVYDCFIKNPNGAVYNSSTLSNAIGHTAYLKLFTKLQYQPS